MRFLPLSILWTFGIVGFAVPATLKAQRPDPTPSTSESQSGYPDVRKEAADPTLFPDPDKVAGDLIRPKSARDSNDSVVGGPRQKRGGLGRTNSQTLGQADADPLPVRVAYRRAKTLAMEHDPELSILLKKADLANTDPEKRQYLRAYYLQLFAQVRKIDASAAMKSHLEALQVSTEQRYDPKRRGVAAEADLINGRLFGQPVTAR